MGNFDLIGNVAAAYHFHQEFDQLLTFCCFVGFVSYQRISFMFLLEKQQIVISMNF